MGKSVTISEPESSIAPIAWWRNFFLGLSAFSIIGFINSFSRHLVLLRIKSLFNIFWPPCVIVQKWFLAYAGRLCAYPAPKRVIARLNPFDNTLFLLYIIFFVNCYA